MSWPCVWWLPFDSWRKFYNFRYYIQWTQESLFLHIFALNLIVSGQKKGLRVLSFPRYYIYWIFEIIWFFSFPSFPKVEAGSDDLMYERVILKQQTRLVWWFVIPCFLRPSGPLALSFVPTSTENFMSFIIVILLLASKLVAGSLDSFSCLSRL